MHVIRQKGESGMGLFIRDWSNGRGGTAHFYSADGTVWYPSRELAKRAQEHGTTVKVIGNVRSIVSKDVTADAPKEKQNYARCEFCASWVHDGYESDRQEWACVGAAEPPSTSVAISGTRRGLPLKPPFARRLGCDRLLSPGPQLSVLGVARGDNWGAIAPKNL